MVQRNCDLLKYLGPNVPVSGGRENSGFALGENRGRVTTL